MHNASADAAACSYHNIYSCSEDILENKQKISRLAPNVPNSAESPSVRLRILNAGKLVSFDGHQGDLLVQEMASGMAR